MTIQRNISILICVLFIFPMTSDAQQYRQYHVPGDTIYVSADLMPNLSMAKSGSERLFWDFSGLLAPYVYEIYMRPASALQEEQTGAEMSYIGPDGVERFLTVEEGNTWLTAFRADLDGENAYLGLCDTPIPVRPARLVLDAREEFSCSCTFRVPAQWFGALGLNITEAVDEVRINVLVNMSTVHDDQGEMITPLGPYLSFRQRRDISSDVSVEFLQDGTWETGTRRVDVKLPIELSPGRSYTYWSPLHPDPLAVVYTDVNDAVKSVQFRTKPDRGRVISSIPKNPDVFVYPNPSFGHVRFDFVNLRPGLYELEIYDILGVRKKAEPIRIMGDKTVSMDLTFLKKGTYIYRLVDSEKNALRSKRLVIITP